MKKLWVILIALVLAAPCFAAVGVQHSGVSVGTATDINFDTGLTASSDGSTVTVAQDQTAVAITGGTINGAVIGGTTPAAIHGTTIDATTTVKAGTAMHAQTTVAAGTTVTAGTGITCTTGNIVCSAGNISASSGGIAAGAALTAGTNITSTGGNIVASAGNVNGATGVSFRTSLSAIGNRSGVSTMVSGSTAVPVNVMLVQKYAGTTAQACTLANGIAGQVEKIIVSTFDAGSSIVITPTTATGYTTITMNALRQFVTLYYVDDTYGWIVIGINGATLA